MSTAPDDPCFANHLDEWLEKAAALRDWLYTKAAKAPPECIESPAGSIAHHLTTSIQATIIHPAIEHKAVLKQTPDPANPYEQNGEYFSRILNMFLNGIDDDIKKYQREENPKHPRYRLQGETEPHEKLLINWDEVGGCKPSDLLRELDQITRDFMKTHGLSITVAPLSTGVNQR